MLLALHDRLPLALIAYYLTRHTRWLAYESRYYDRLIYQVPNPKAGMLCPLFLQLKLIYGCRYYGCLK
jgi:hypothetical protein